MTDYSNPVDDGRVAAMARDIYNDDVVAVERYGVSWERLAETNPNVQRRYRNMARAALYASREYNE